MAAVPESTLPLDLRRPHPRAVVAARAERPDEPGRGQRRSAAAGTYARPLLFGRDRHRAAARVDFEGKRYVVRRGTIDFNNPTRIEPFFDIETEARVPRARRDVPRHRPRGRHRSGQRADVLVRSGAAAGRAAGAARRATSRRAGTSSSAQYADVTPQEQLFRERVTRALTGVVSSEIGRAVEQALGFDTFQLTTSLLDPNQQSARLDPGGARDLGKRLSEQRLPDLLAQPVVVHTRPDHPAGDRSDGPALVDPLAQRGWDLRARSARQTDVLMTRFRIQIRCKRGVARRVALATRDSFAFAFCILHRTRASTPDRRADRRGRRRAGRAGRHRPARPRPDRDDRRRAAVDARRARDDRAPREPAPVRRHPADGRGGRRWRARAYVLVPSHPVDRVEFTGTLGVSEADLRRLLTERFGGAPAAGRAAEAAEIAASDLSHARLSRRPRRARGSRKRTIPIARRWSSRSTPAAARGSPTSASCSSTRMRKPAMTGIAGHPGRRGPYDAEAVDEALRDWENRLRERGYYEARASHRRRHRRRRVSAGDVQARPARRRRLRRRSAAGQRARAARARPRRRIGRRGSARGRRAGDPAVPARARLSRRDGDDTRAWRRRRADHHLHRHARRRATPSTRSPSTATPRCRAAEVREILRHQGGRSVRRRRP